MRLHRAGEGIICIKCCIPILHGAYNALNIHYLTIRICPTLGAPIDSFLDAQASLAPTHVRCKFHQFFHRFSTDFSKLHYSKLYFSKCTRLAYLLSFASLFTLCSFNSLHTGYLVTSVANTQAPTFLETLPVRFKKLDMALTRIPTGPPGLPESGSVGMKQTLPVSL